MPPLRRLIALYDRLYRRLHGLDRPEARVGPLLTIAVRRLRRARRLPDGTWIPSGERIAVLHLDNARAVTLRTGGRPRSAVGLEFRRQLVASLRALAELAQPGAPLADVRAFAATTIFHRGLARLGFMPEPDDLPGAALVAAYQRRLIATLVDGQLPLPPARFPRSRRLWIPRDTLLRRYGGAPIPTRRKRAPS